MLGKRKFLPCADWYERAKGEGTEALQRGTKQNVTNRPVLPVPSCSKVHLVANGDQVASFATTEVTQCCWQRFFCWAQCRRAAIWQGRPQIFPPKRRQRRPRMRAAREACRRRRRRR